MFLIKSARLCETASLLKRVKMPEAWKPGDTTSGLFNCLLPMPAPLSSPRARVAWGHTEGRTSPPHPGGLQLPPTRAPPSTIGPKAMFPKAGVPKPRVVDPVPVCGLLGTGPHSRR